MLRLLSLTKRTERELHAPKTHVYEVSFGRSVNCSPMSHISSSQANRGTLFRQRRVKISRLFFGIRFWGEKWRVLHCAERRMSVPQGAERSFSAKSPHKSIVWALITSHSRNVGEGSNSSTSGTTCFLVRPICPHLTCSRLLRKTG